MGVKRIFQILILASTVWSFISYSGVFCEEQEHVIKITVKPGTIGMPGNKAWKVPLKYARVRSTDLRDLMKACDIDKDATIEKVFEWKEVNGQFEKIEIENTYIIKYSADKISESSINELVVEQTKLPEVVAVEKTTVSTVAEPVSAAIEEISAAETEIAEEVRGVEEKPGTRRRRRSNRNE